MTGSIFRKTRVFKRIYSWLWGQYVGQDALGNCYYTQKASDEAPKKRWVVYKGIAEASKISPEWHGWLHYTHEAPLGVVPGDRCQKKQYPDLTGTALSYQPNRLMLQEKTRVYEPWQPYGASYEIKYP